MFVRQVSSNHLPQSNPGVLNPQNLTVRCILASNVIDLCLIINMIMAKVE